jgi:hypothetical protein
MFKETQLELEDNEPTLPLFENIDILKYHSHSKPSMESRKSKEGIFDSNIGSLSNSGVFI